MQKNLFLKYFHCIILLRGVDLETMDEYYCNTVFLGLHMFSGNIYCFVVIMSWFSGMSRMFLKFTVSKMKEYDRTRCDSICLIWW